MWRKNFWAIVILALTIFFGFSIISYKGEKKVQNTDHKSISCSGTAIKAISIAFEDYSKGREGYKKDIECYDFEFSFEHKNQMKIEISLDIEAVSKRTNAQLVVGGGAKYIIDVNSWQIVDKEWYK